ncbi:MAG: peptide-methionine (S)-S-oxide reductase MsrA [Ignavibacteriales bacterium]|nr:peptide-methionine (S)-S-oxide reductase MsrA [Ignavibacteriales bacterium]MCF8316650.1 peptide-methionine (S)-S-oxide reductase MsrA [Ignavibacteriales bacterium]MCF8438306.1 peptide-methionine (S)-S-oxide reductase MsrA [Ignavibacteriales bacterium]
MLKRDIMYKYIMLFFLLSACNLSGEADKEKYRDNEIMDKSNLETATFGAGCFWCVEAVFQRVKGVEKVVSGYSGGSVKNPTYDQVCTGRTGHAEVIQIEFDPAIVSFSELLEIFWSTHDPTTLNRQGADIGTQYRSAVFYHSEAQKESAEFYKNKLGASGVYSSPVVTEITKFDLFYAAEKYHQDYYDNNSSQPYCSFVITPKLEKFKKVFKEKLK